MHHILFFILKLISRLPFGVLYAISDAMYFPLYYVIRYRRKVVRKNITESFPEKTRAEVVDIEKRFYRFFIDLMFESVKLCTISPEEIKRRAVFKNIELLNSLLENGQSVAVYIGHIGNWEWISTMGQWLTDKAEAVQIYHPLNNRFFNDFMIQLRERFGNICVAHRNTARYITQALKEGKTLGVGFIADQSPRWRDSKYFLHFLNHEVPAITGTERIAKHYGFEALYLSARRVKRGHYEYEFIPLCDNPSSLPDFELTDMYFNQLERNILQQPELYLWSHKRFKYARK